jgi:hypothetical protein
VGSPIDRFDVGTRVLGIGVPFGSLDVVGQVPGGVRVAGWVIDPDADLPATVHVYVGDRLVAGVIADDPRPDVAAAYPRYGAARGFEIVVPAPPGVHNVCAYAIDVNGDPNLNRLLACRLVEVRGRPIGNLDRVESAPGGVRVAGWAIDPEISGPLDVHVYVDGALAGGGRADRPRGDVGAAYPAHGSAHGFDVVVPANLGWHEVCVYAIDGGSGVSGNPSLGCRPVRLASTPFGHLDAATRTGGGGVRITGWAIDPTTADAIDVHVYADGALVGSARANLVRMDVAAQHQAYGPAHGFDAIVPVPAGARQVCVFGIARTPGANSLVGCRNV